MKKGKQKIKLIVVLLSAIFLITSVSTLLNPIEVFAAGPNLLTNGSFETPICSTPTSFTTYSAGSSTLTGWAIGGSGIDHMCPGNWQTDNGSRNLDLSALSAGSVSQSFATEVGAKYLVSFDMAGNFGCGNTIKKMTVTAPGYSNQFSFDTTGKNALNMGWTTHSFSFVATSPSSNVQFTSNENNACGPTLDNVRVEVLPPNPPAFSQNITPVFDGQTCLQMEAEEPGIHYWFVKPDASGLLTINVNAVSVNPSAESGSITATLFDGATNLGATTVLHPVSPSPIGSSNTETIPFTADPTKIYRLEVFAGPIIPPQTQQARHYSLEVTGGSADLGINSPSQRYFEHQLQAFHLNVNSGESLTLQISVDSPPANGVNQATSVSFDVRDSSGVLLYSQPSTPISPATPINVSLPAALSADSRLLLITGDGHFRISKTSGADAGLYVDGCPKINAQDDSGITDEDTSVNIGVLGNDTPFVTITSATDPANGSVIVNPDGTITYAPDANYVGIDTFTYTISDGFGGMDTAIVTITVNPVNDSPIANDDAYSTDEDVTLIVSAPGVLANDDDGDPETTQILTANLVSGTSNGVLSLNSDGSFTYTPNPNFSGTDSFTYQAGDGTLLSEIITVTIIVNPLNDAPVAVDDSTMTSQGVPIDVAVLGNDSDPENNTLVVQSFTQPANGIVSDPNNDGILTYAPNAGFFGVDTFTYTISDGFGGTSTATVNITVEQAIQGGPTRTQGFWSTHLGAATQVWNSMSPADRIIGTKNMGNGPASSDISEMMGGFWSNVAKKSDNSKRTALDQARMQLAQQLLAAMLNRAAFGTDDGGLISAGKAAFAGTNTNNVLNVASDLAAFNEGGDTQPLPSGFNQGSADPKSSQSTANKAFWNTLP